MTFIIAALTAVLPNGKIMTGMTSNSVGGAGL
jgi:hypothetical protein